MNVYAQDLLNSSSSSQSQSSSTQSQATSTDLNNLNINNSFLDPFVSWLNAFVLAWSIFYSVYFLAHFFFYRIFFGTGEMAQEKKGVKGIVRLLGIWWRYIACLVFLVIYGLTKDSLVGLAFGVLAIFVMLAKLYIDLARIMDLFEYFVWSKNIAKTVKKWLNWKG